MTMTEKKHAIKPYPLGAHVEDGAIRFAYASGKKDCGILIYDRKSGKKTHRVPFRQEERMGNVYCKYLELEPENVGYQFYEEERTVPDLHAQGFLRKPAYGKIRKPADRIAVFPNEDFDWEQDMHPMLPYEDSTCYCPLRTQSDKKESPAALYDRAAGARWGICLSENNHRIRKHAC